MALLIRCCLLSIVALMTVGPLVAADAPTEPTKQVSFARDIQPLLQAHCQGCHQPAKASGGTVLTSYASLQKPGESGTSLIVPGKPEESELLRQVVAAEGEKPAMPKGAAPLAAAQIDLLRRWISEGAADDSPAQSADPIDREHPPVYTSPPVLSAIDYSPDGSLLAVSGFHEVLLYKADGSELVARLVGLSERIESLAFSPDGTKLAVSGGSPARMGEIQIWDVSTRELKHSIPVTYDTLFGVSWSPDGTRIAFGCTDNTVRALEANSGQQVLYQGAHADWVLDTVFSKDASHLISVSRDRSMKLTEVATQRFVDNITSITPGALKGGLMTVDRHPTEDHLLIGGSDGIPKLYQTYRTQARVIGDDFNLIRQFEALPGRIYSAEFSADGNRLVVASSYDQHGEVRVYQTADAAKLATLAGQKGPVYAVAFRPDGAQIASGGFDGMVRLNDAQSGALLKEFVPVPLTTAVAAASQANN
jgi:WD40 repeat protein/mono/diheme cytochrome c family protein